MKITMIISVLLVATQAFAIMAPVGEYSALSCVPVSGPKFQLVVLKNTQNKSVKLAIGEQKYPAQELVSQRVGGPTVYTATVPGGKWTLTYNATTAPTPRGRKATLVSQVYGRATKTEMLCSRVMY